VKKGTKNIEQTQQIADAEAIINYLTLSTSILVFTLLRKITTILTLKT
jgi:hypothetical protein